MQRQLGKRALPQAIAGTLLAAGTLAAPAVLAEEHGDDLGPDGSWVSISGTVTEVMSDLFLLDYGDGTLPVEMDDWDSYGDAYVLTDGDRVTVYGRVDDGLYESETIEASSVYVEGLNSYFYASAADEEEIGEWSVVTPIVLGDLVLIGTVESVNTLTDTFTIDSGVREMTVDVSPLLYDPLDDEGYQKIEVGDRVSVEGNIDYTLFDNRVLKAEAVTTLESAS